MPPLETAPHSQLPKGSIDAVRLSTYRPDGFSESSLVIAVLQHQGIRPVVVLIVAYRHRLPLPFVLRRLVLFRKLLFFFDLRRSRRFFSGISAVSFVPVGIRSLTSLSCATSSYRGFRSL